ncbi:MAG: ATP-binding protein [Candidatus Omnitrophota bacterium]
MNNPNNLEPLLNQLNLKTPVTEIKSQDYQIIHTFLKNELEFKKQHRVKRLLCLSGIKQIKTFEHFDWTFNLKMPKEDILDYKNSPWIDKAYNLTLIGDSGLGKTHIAKALCYEAIIQGHTALFITAFDLISKVNKAFNPSAKIDYFAKIRVLAIDELGYTFHDKQAADILFQIISKRSEILPVIVTTNLVPKNWGSIFSGAAASAILDRLSYNGRFITLEGKSYRLLKKHKSIQI